MANKSDGSIRVNVKLDTDEVKGDLNGVEKMCGRTADKIRKIADVSIDVKGADVAEKSIESTLDGVKKMAEIPVKLVIKNDAQLAKTKKRIQELADEVASVQNYTDSMLAQSATDEQAANVLEMEEHQIGKLTAEMNELNVAVDEYVAKLQRANAEKERVKAEKQEKADIRSANADVSAQTVDNSSWINSIKSMEQYEAAVNSTKARIAELEAAAERAAKEKGVDVNAVLAANKEYQKATSRLKELTSAETKRKIASDSAWKTSQEGAKNFGDSMKSAIKQMAKYTLTIFGARSAYMALKAVMQQYISDNDEISNTIESMKGVIGEMLGPAIEYVVDVLKYALAYLNQFIKVLTGVDFVARYNAKQLKKQADATRENSKAQKEYNKLQLASFDTVEKLDDEESSSNESSATDGFIPLTLPDVSGGAFDEFAENVKKHLMEIVAIASVFLLAIGVLLTFTGINIPLGIALIIMGLAGIAVVAAKWGSLTPEVQKTITAILAIGGALMLILGIILCVAGVSLPVGIALIVAGAVMLVSAAALNFNKIIELAQGPFGKILAIAGASMLVLGIILCVTGAVPLGIGLIIAGIGALGVAAYANKDSIVKWVSDVWNSIVNFWDTKIAPIFTLKFWKEKFDVIKNAFKGAINGVLESIKNPISWLVPQMSETNSTGLQSFGVNSSEVELPRLARGAIVNKPGRGVDVTTGENGPEAILPLQNYTEWMDVLAEKIVTLMASLPQSFNITATGSMSQLIRLLRLEISKDNSAATAWR